MGFNCEYCSYKTTFSSKHVRHIKTKKHIAKINEEQQKTINLMTQQIENQNKSIESLKIIVMELTKKDTTHIINHNTTNIINNHETTFNINVFLNEDCKHAMDFIEFMKNIKFDFNDLQKLGEEGYVNYVSKIMKNGLLKCSVTERPIHCHINDETETYKLMVKNEDSWIKNDNFVKELFDKGIYELDRKMHRINRLYAHSAKQTNVNAEKELWNHSGTGRFNEPEQTEIIANIAPSVLIPS